MRKYLVIILIILWAMVLLPRLKLAKRFCPFRQVAAEQKIETSRASSVDEGLVLLKKRKDIEALAIFTKVLAAQPDNLDALWGKGEVLRHRYRLKEAEEIFQQVIKKDPQQASALLSLAYSKYRNSEFDAALKLVQRAMKSKTATKENLAIAYTLLGGINGLRASKGWFMNKLLYGTQVKSYFVKAEQLGPDMPEPHLGLGTFYLKAPAIAGGNLDKAIKELETATEIAPDFATPYARLAQAYLKKGNLAKYNFYLTRAKKIDPENEALKD